MLRERELLPSLSRRCRPEVAPWPLEPATPRGGRSVVVRLVTICIYRVQKIEAIGVCTMNERVLTDVRPVVAQAIRTLQQVLAGESGGAELSWGITMGGKDRNRPGKD